MSLTTAPTPSPLEWAWQQPCGSGSAKVVLVCLARHANADGVVAVPLPELAAETDLTIRTVHRNLQLLRDLGKVSWTQPSRRHPNLYRLHLGPVESASRGA